MAGDGAAGYFHRHDGGVPFRNDTIKTRRT